MLRVCRCFLLVTLATAAGPIQANEELVDTVIGFLKDADKEIQAIAFEQIRGEIKGAEATSQFAAQLPNLQRNQQLGLIRALGDRGDAVAKPAISKFVAEKNDDELRVAAIGALGKLGDTTDCVTLVQLLADQSVVAAARQALVSLQGDGLAEELVKQIDAAANPLKVTLIEVLTERRAKDAVPDLLKLAQGPDPELRSAAMNALGQLADPGQVPALANAILVATPGNERNNAERNLARVCNRIEDPQQRAEPLLTAMPDLDPSERTKLLPALGRIGGKDSLAAICDAVLSDDQATHTAGIRGLSNWPNASVADLLIVVAEKGPHPDHRRIARLTILRIAPLPDGRSDIEKLELLKHGMQLAENDAERNYGLKRAAPIRLVETLRFILPYVDQAPYAKQACQSIVELAHDRKLRDDNKQEFHDALDKVLATTKDPVLIDRANRYKQGQTWVRQK